MKRKEAQLLGGRVLGDELDEVGHVVDLVGVGIVDLHAELLLNAHDNLHRVQAVQSELLERDSGADLAGVDLVVLLDRLQDPVLDLLDVQEGAGERTQRRLQHHPAGKRIAGEERGEPREHVGECRIKITELRPPLKGRNFLLSLRNPKKVLHNRKGVFRWCCCLDLGERRDRGSGSWCSSCQCVEKL
jgi:hypothetical protein